MPQKILTAQKIKICNICRSLLCFCHSSKRNQKKLCIIQNDQELAAIERSGFYNGLYYVIDEKNKIKINNKIKEIIIATSPSAQGDLLALKIKEALKNKKIKLTRLAQGLPTGADIEYADAKTLKSALENRKEL